MLQLPQVVETNPQINKEIIIDQEAKIACVHGKEREWNVHSHRWFNKQHTQSAKVAHNKKFHIWMKSINLCNVRPFTSWKGTKKTKKEKQWEKNQNDQHNCKMHIAL